MNSPDRFLDWKRDTRRPHLRLPAGACDCAVHLFDPAHAHRLLADRRYEPPVATAADMQRLHQQLGVERVVLVQPSIYGTDHSVLLTALREDPVRRRGVALIDERVDDRMLREMQDAGVRSARFNILSRFGQPFDSRAFLRDVQRAQAMGWSISLHGTAAELAAHEALLFGIEAPVIVDHAAYVAPADPHVLPGGFLDRALDRGNWWLKLSRLDHRLAPPYEAAVALIQQLVERAASRLLWATDWPHVLYGAADCLMPDDADLVDLLQLAIPDAQQREAVLTHNPAQLFAFPHR